MLVKNSRNRFNAFFRVNARGSFKQFKSFANVALNFVVAVEEEDVDNAAIVGG